MNLEKAIEFMKQKHGNQKRKQGTPYYTHPLAVAELLKSKGFSEEYQLAGLFHDLIEDTNATYEEIIALSNENVAEAVRLVSKTDGYVMTEYIGNIKENDMARMVKIADRIHNLSESPAANRKFQERYIKETKEWFVDLAKGTVFEGDLNSALENLIRVYESEGIDR
ncbi:MAG: bifunctional (p)ppGpp synthetase/guanosine-3',5'-bis(diphosphate) 3'-pyrophosphohydrolase [Clostridia bacterium]|nr:bifunctional (p)ppGpp synthetase/guanosine-3',5'-bis(diphosphate) 3'-pyrophosphohydrolase [Clostridia bacterium]